MKPQPRPALKRAEDADLHPALSVAPAQLPTHLARDLTPAGSLAKAGKPDTGKGKAKTKTKVSAKAAKTIDGKRFQSAGQATSDSLRARPDKDTKLVKLSVKVPKRLRQEVRAIAKHSGGEVDDIVAQALSEWLGDPRRW